MKQTSQVALMPGMVQMRFTICFIRQGDDVLLLHRRKEPNQGLWNGVGGKIEPGEAPLDACIREVWEETGLRLPDLTFRGLVTWNRTSGMYLFTGDTLTRHVVESSEGELRWHSVEWIRTSSSVVDNIPYYLDAMFGDAPPVEHAFSYTDEGSISSYDTYPLEVSWFRQVVSPPHEDIPSL